MDWNNVLTLFGVFAGTAIAAYVGYSRKWPAKPPVDPVLTGIGLGFGDKELVIEMRRCAVALEILADRRTDEMAEMHRELLDRLDRQAEQEEARPRSPPQRRR